MAGDIPLGKETHYRFDYDASLLFPVARQETRSALGIGENLPFYGEDVWTAYELSWLNAQGLPQVAIAEIRFPCGSDNLVESKSLKLYLNSFNQTVFADQNALAVVMQRDLSAVCGAGVSLQFFAVDDYPLQKAEGFVCLDGLPVSCTQYQPDASLLQVTQRIVTARWCSHVFRSLCPVTGQPDWASLYIDYQGLALQPESLLQYLVSFRQHQGFHEQCVEMIYQHLMQAGQAQQLTVSARFVRRGGLDINPVRSNKAVFSVPGRQGRQ